jgi:transcriptional regulator with XRE-family HTH domain
LERIRASFLYNSLFLIRGNNITNLQHCQVLFTLYRGFFLVEKIGLRVRELRKAQNLTQEHLAEKAEISYKYLGEIERGEINPGIINLSKIARGLALPLKEIVNVDMESSSEESSLREEILGLLAGKIPDDLKKALRVLRAVFR